MPAAGEPRLRARFRRLNGSWKPGKLSPDGQESPACPNPSPLTVQTAGVAYLRLRRVTRARAATGPDSSDARTRRAALATGYPSGTWPTGEALHRRSRRRSWSAETK